ncbi:MAG: hypothetical protein ACRBCJ_01935 [Hyphomicrobiaceae bacterium]
MSNSSQWYDLKISTLGACLGLSLLAGGCASDGGANGDPGARALPQGRTCKSTHAELRKLDRKGVPSKIERANAGKKLSGKDRADVDRYNRLLNEYLGARCHA